MDLPSRRQASNMSVSRSSLFSRT